MPDAGSGKNPRNPEDTGWDVAWNTQLPATRDELRALLLSGCSGDTTWTELAEQNESLPANCVSWLLAQAFCIWDGGRLPTQAEWNFVAAGGTEQRVYPWSMPAESTTIGAMHAVFDTSESADVGSREPGLGKWGHYDLAGNVVEWVFDVYEDCYRTPDQCNDCGHMAGDNPQKTARGGAYSDPGDYVRVETRMSNIDVSQHPLFGFRCARNL
jgi:formylglycine-generating enzyme required for sulfatase activity